MIVGFLAFQALVFAAWVVTSFSILWVVLRRATATAAFPGPSVQLTAWADFLRDPATRRRRWVWLSLTVLLFALAAMTFLVLGTGLALGPLPG